MSAEREVGCVAATNMLESHMVKAIISSLAVMALGCQSDDYSDVGDLSYVADAFGCDAPESARIQRACEILTDFPAAGPVSFPSGEHIYLGLTYCAEGYEPVFVTTLGPPTAPARGVDAEHAPPGSLTRLAYDVRRATKVREIQPFDDNRPWQARLIDGSQQTLPDVLTEELEAPMYMPTIELSTSDGVSLLPEQRGIRRGWFSRAPDTTPNAFLRATSDGELLYLRLSPGGHYCVERAFRVEAGDGPARDG